MAALPGSSLDVIFRSARTFNGFADKPVSDADLRAIYDLMKFGPTSANSSPARFVFVRTPAAKEKLRPALSAGNLEKTMKARCTVIVAHDLEFYEHLPTLFPHVDARAWFVGNAAFAETTAFRNGSLQGAYFIIAARALGFDCGPMSGFDNGKLDAAFFADAKVKSNFLINLGHGDPASIFARNPRLTFEQACRVD